jgi:bifunctional DNase/RNase
MKLNKRRQDPSRVMMALLAVVITLLFLNLYITYRFSPSETDAGNGNGAVDIPSLPSHIDLPTPDGFTLAENITADTGAVHLDVGCSRVTISVSDMQAYSIFAGLQGIVEYRPTTHDIMRDMMEAYGIEPLMVRITYMEDGTYFAELVMVGSSRVLNIDSRPSDAIAIAVRTATPVYVADSLMEEQAETIC